MLSLAWYDPMLVESSSCLKIKNMDVVYILALYPS